jgi:hypothetical protein
LLFQKALSKSRDSKEKGIIHFQLWILKLKRNDPPKEILRHAIEYGKTTKDDPEDESRFLMMVLMSPSISEDYWDDDIKSWVGDFRTRLNKFTEDYPSYEAFTKFSIPDHLSDEEKAFELRAELAKLMLPNYLATVPFEFSTRTTPWFLPLRARLLPECNSVFDFWRKCIESDDYSHSIHIWNGAKTLVDENQYASTTKEVCIDLTALLALAELRLLDKVSSIFDRIYLAFSTKRLMDEALSPSWSTSYC